VDQPGRIAVFWQGIAVAVAHTAHAGADAGLGQAWVQFAQRRGVFAVQPIFTANRQPGRSPPQPLDSALHRTKIPLHLPARTKMNFTRKAIPSLIRATRLVSMPALARGSYN